MGVKIIPLCGKCDQELNTDENTTLINLGQDHKCSQDSLSWGELADLTHGTQVERFGWCGCEDNEGNENPYTDCPKSEAQEKAFNRAIIGEVLSQGANPITVISIMARYLTAHEAESVANEIRLEL